MIPILSYIPMVSTPNHQIEQVDAKYIQNSINASYSIFKLDRNSRNHSQRLANQFREQGANLPYEWLSGFIESAQILLKFSPEKINVEVTSANSIYMPCKIGDKNVHWEIFFNAKNFPKVVLNIFEHQKQIFSDSGAPKLMSRELNLMFKDRLPAINYGIPNNTPATTVF